MLRYKHYINVLVNMTVAEMAEVEESLFAWSHQETFDKRGRLNRDKALSREPSAAFTGSSV